jgi:hypothetical protein
MKILAIKMLLGLLTFGLAGMALTAFGDDSLDPALQAKVDARVKAIQAWASDPVLVNAVKAQNASLPPDYAAMTQDKWKDLSKLDPFVRSFDKNAAGQFLKSKKSEVIIRAFLSDAAGLKVAFTAKTLSWSHRGDPKHEAPMTGKTWHGPLEQDKASGLEQVQVSVPILDGDKPIGSLVVGLSVSNL